MERKDLLNEIERRSTTLDLGIYEKATGTRRSLLGPIGEALRDAAEHAKEQPVACPHCGALDSAVDDHGLIYCSVCHYVVD